MSFFKPSEHFGLVPSRTLFLTLSERGRKHGARGFAPHPGPRAFGPHVLSSQTSVVADSTKGRKRPKRRVVAEPRLDRIPFDVPSDLLMVLAVSNQPVKEIRLPQTPATSKRFVDALRRIALERTNDVCQSNPRERCDEQVDVVRHDAPSVQNVLLSVVKNDRLVDDLAGNRVP